MVNLGKIVPALILGAAGEAFVLTLLVPQYLPHNPLLWTLLRTLPANFLIFAIWQIAIYPFFFSPLRHLPHPKVRHTYSWILISQ